MILIGADGVSVSTYHFYHEELRVSDELPVSFSYWAKEERVLVM